MDNLILYISCAFLGAAGAWSIYRIGAGIGLLDKANERSSHEGIVPKGGGIGILVAFLVSSIVLSVPNLFWIPAVMLSLCSLWGDRSEIKPRTRLMIQFVAGIILLAAVLFEKESTALTFALLPMLSIFVVGTANYYNFMDGINGIAGITGVVGFGLLSWFAVAEGADPRLSAMSLGLSLACLGFLPFNMPQARVFMGDVGSIMLGFVFAGLVAWLSESLLDFICTAAFIFPFYADEFTTLFVRIKEGDRLTTPHRKHLYQILANQKGIGHWKISVAYGVLQLSIGISVLLMKSHGIILVLSILGIYFGAFVHFSNSLRKNIAASA